MLQYWRVVRQKFNATWPMEKCSLVATKIYFLSDISIILPKNVFEQYVSQLSRSCDPFIRSIYYTALGIQTLLRPKSSTVTTGRSNHTNWLLYHHVFKFISLYTNHLPTTTRSPSSSAIENLIYFFLLLYLFYGFNGH